MYRIVVLWILLFSLSVAGWANNVRITKDAYINQKDIVNNIATIDLSIAWENSWRDDFNWDAVYIFLKYKLKNESDWKHVYLKDTDHTMTEGVGYWMARSTTTVDRREGIFVYRKQNGKGDMAVDLHLKWLITQNGLTSASFSEGKVTYTALCIEMVYIPKGPFNLSDGVATTLSADGTSASSNRLKSEFRTILPEWDLIKNDGSVGFMGSGREVDSNQYRIYCPENVANRVNDPRHWNNGSHKNAWYPPVTPSYNLTIDFKTAKTIRWFGINHCYGGGASPSSWTLYGMVDLNTEGDLLFEGKAADWRADAYNSYPITKALKIERPRAYRYYQIRSVERPVINNLSMTEKDLDALTENVYVVDRQTTVYIDPETGLSSGSGLKEGKWNSATLNGYYPTGFEGFYAMKYAISQEQYVKFLNKLQDKQKQRRTIGESVMGMQEKQYVYGANREQPNCRNGITVGMKNEDALVFANDLNQKDKDVAQATDGQNIACNYLSPADMLAYADWTGLRPLSEMEYEKMSRAPWPGKAIQYEWAGGSKDNLKMPQLTNQILDKGMPSERLAVVNVNAGAKEEGPVRGGAFAKGKTQHTEAGASFWGVMELSGNLGEIYYNVEPVGRTFDFRQESHGDGNILGNGDASAGDWNVATGYWPINPLCFTVRGGSFLSANKEDLAVSERKYPTYFSDINQKDSTITFRLGHSCTNLITEQCTTYLKLQNGRVTTADNVAIDSVCSGQTYTITGSPVLESSVQSGGRRVDKLKEFEGRCIYTWFIREHEMDNTHWKLIPGEYGRDLTFSNLKNNADGFRNVYIKRVAITPTFSSETFYARLCVINDNHDFMRLQDTIKVSNQTKGFYVETHANASFVWKWNAASLDSKPLKNDVVNGTYDYFFPKRENFDNVGKQTHYVTCDISVLNKCKSRVNLKVYVEERLNVGMASSDITPLGKGDARTQCGVLMLDSRDGNVYGTVQIGTQCWMAENLRYKMEGYAIPQQADPTGEKLGLLYKWDGQSVVKNNSCPAGWRLPANADFELLRTFLNSDKLNQQGKKMKAANYWTVYNRDQLGTNSSGFGAFGTGYNGNNSYYGQQTQYVTSDGYYYQLVYSDPTFTGAHGNAAGYYFTIRCIRR